MEANEQILEWMITGERGISSETMAFVAMGLKPKRDYDHPHDPADFNRCLKLVKAAPSVRAAFPKIAKRSKQWAALIEHWDELETAFVNEVGWDWSKSHSAKNTYRKMQELFA